MTIFRPIKMYFDSFWINRTLGSSRAESPDYHPGLSPLVYFYLVFCGLTLYFKPNVLSPMTAIELHYCSPLSNLHHGINYWIANLNIRNVPYRNRKMY